MRKLKVVFFVISALVLSVTLTHFFCGADGGGYVRNEFLFTEQIISDDTGQVGTGEEFFEILPLASDKVTVILKIDGQFSTKQVTVGENLTVVLEGCKAAESVGCGDRSYSVSDDGKTVTVFEVISMMPVVSITTYEKHEFDTLVSVEKAATCISDGLGTFSCSSCGLQKDNVIIPATGNHIKVPESGFSPVESISAENWIRLKCSTCGYSDYRYMSGGSYVKDSAVVFEDGTRFFGVDGNMVTGNYTYSDGKTADFSVSGLIINGWLRNGATWNYYTDGKKSLGVTETQDGIYCFTAESGTLITSKAEVVTIDGELSVCYFGADGKMTEKVTVTDNENGCWIDIAGRTMFVKNGKYAQGKTEIDGKWYYFNSYGRRAENTEEVIDGRLYFFDGEGTPSEVEVDENGFAEVNGKIIFVEGNSIVKSDFREINGTLYYFNSVGRLMTDTIESVGGKLYLIRTDGSCTVIDRDGYYNTGNKMMRVYDGIVARNVWIEDEYYNSVGRRTENVAIVIGSELAEFDENGKLIGKIVLTGMPDGFTDALGSGRTVFIKDGMPLIGWIEYGESRYYANSEYRVLRNTVQVIDGVLYSFGADGEAENQLVLAENVGMFAEVLDRLVCVKPDGTLAKSEWVTITVPGVGTFEVYANSMYRILRNTVAVIDGVLCEFDIYGRATKTDLSQIAGMMPSPTVTGRVIYVDADGQIRTGFVTIGEDLYYFNSSYRMLESCVLTVDGKVYEFGSDGRCINVSESLKTADGFETSGLSEDDPNLKSTVVYRSSSYLEIGSVKNFPALKPDIKKQKMA